jgi:hypothetical protein
MPFLCLLIFLLAKGYTLIYLVVWSKNIDPEEKLQLVKSGGAALVKVFN